MMNMTSPFRRGELGIGVHICVIYEKTATSAYPITKSSTTTTTTTTYPLIFMHSTSNYKIATIRGETIPNIRNIRKYSELKDYCIWEIPKTEDRTIDLSTTITLVEDSFNAAIDSIVKLIKTYKIVYLINLPYNYSYIIEHVQSKWWSSWSNERNCK